MSKKKKSMNSLLHKESLLKRSQGPHMLSALLSHTSMKSLPEQLLLVTDDDTSQEHQKSVETQVKAICGC